MMPTVCYLRGAPGTGKNTVARIIERDLGWPRLWVHQLDSVYRVIGNYKVPRLTDTIMRAVANHLCEDGKDFLFVRPSRDSESVYSIRDMVMRFHPGYQFVAVKLTASYQTLVTRVTRRWAESPFRLTTKESLDEYLNARPESDFPGEHVIDTTALTPEQVAGRIKELLAVPREYAGE